MKTKAPLTLIAENYRTYVNDVTKARERHYPRLIVQLGISLFVALWIKKIGDDAISVLITSISILIGFAFTALFPIAGDGLGKLAAPEFSDDWDDIKRIRLVIKNFRKNVSYFIPLSLIFVLFLFAQMITIDDKAAIIRWIIKRKQEFCAINHCWFSPRSSFTVISSCISLFLLAEIAYTFYRMCFNALSILRIKDEYEEGRMKDRSAK